MADMFGKAAIVRDREITGLKDQIRQLRNCECYLSIFGLLRCDAEESTRVYLISFGNHALRPGWSDKAIDLQPPSSSSRLLDAVCHMAGARRHLPGTNLVKQPPLKRANLA